MAAASFLAITMIPVLMTLFIRGRIPREESNPITRFFIWSYRPCIEFVLRFPKTVVLIAILVVALTWFPLKRLGSEFMPPLYEGDFLWMPTTDPGISITKASCCSRRTRSSPAFRRWIVCSARSAVRKPLPTLPL